jgi:osmotically-inducible protein OsmY
MDLTFAAIVIMGGWVIGIIAAGLVIALRPGGAAVRLRVTATSEPAGEREEILLGGEAEVMGNPQGRVQAVRLRPNSWQIQDLELGDSIGLLEGPHVPADAIIAADGRVVELADGWNGAPADEPVDGAIRLSARMTVSDVQGKRLGNLRLVCFDQDSRVVTSLVVERRGGATALRLLPVEQVADIGPDGIATDLKKAHWSSLDAFATDWDLRQAIVDRIAGDPALRAVRRSITVDVHDQRVRLGGYVATQDQIERAAQLARTVPGVLAIERAIVSDEDLAAAVTRAIAQDPRTAAAHVRVTSYFGVVDISGEAPDPATARRIDEVARRIPGVQGVHNMVGVRSVARSA